MNLKLHPESLIPGVFLTGWIQNSFLNLAQFLAPRGKKYTSVRINGNPADMKVLLFAVASLSLNQNLFAQRPAKTENLILITLDGMRWQEVFGGAELRLIANKKFVNDT